MPGARLLVTTSPTAMDGLLLVVNLAMASVSYPCFGLSSSIVLGALLWGFYGIPSAFGCGPWIGLLCLHPCTWVLWGLIFGLVALFVPFLCSVVLCGHCLRRWLGTRSRFCLIAALGGACWPHLFDPLQCLSFFQASPLGWLAAVLAIWPFLIPLGMISAGPGLHLLFQVAVSFF